MFAVHNGFNVGKEREREREGKLGRCSRVPVYTYVRACVCVYSQRMIFFRLAERKTSAESIHPSIQRFTVARFRFHLVSPADKGNEVGLRRPSAEQIATTTTTSQREQPVIGPPRVN